MNFSVFDNHIDACFIISKSRNIKYCNQAAATILSVSQRRIKDDVPIYDYITFDDLTLFCMPDGERGKDEFTPYREMPFKTFKNAEGVGLVSISPIQNEGDNPLWAVFIKDMTVEIQLQRKYKEQLDQKQGVIDELNTAKEELKKYSEDLESMVKERTKELSEANKFINTMINSLDQGLLVFDQDNNCLPIYTKACEQLFQTVPAGKKNYEVLKMNKDDEKSSFLKWSELLFEELIPFEDAVPLGPEKLIIDDRHISLNYFPMRNHDQAIQGVVTVATDISEEVMAKREAKERDEYSKMIIKITASRDQFMQFLQDSSSLLSKFHQENEKTPLNKDKFLHMCRVLHTVKGGASIYSITEIAELAHHIEESVEHYKKNINEIEDSTFKKTMSEQHSSFMADLKKLEEEIFSFAIQNKQILGADLSEYKEKREVEVEELEEFKQKIQDPALLKDFDFTFLRQSLKKSLMAYEPVLRDIADQIGKKIKPIQFKGDDIKISAPIFRDFIANLIHLFRNIADHGIESPEERTNENKDQEGLVSIEFKKDESHFTISISDDGKGVSAMLVRSKIKEKNLNIGDVDQMADDEVIQYIFHPGFSTSENITDLSGRGVGMDAIKSSVEEMNGEVSVSSKMNQGSCFKFKFPLKIIE